MRPGSLADGAIVCDGWAVDRFVRKDGGSEWYSATGPGGTVGLVHVLFLRLRDRSLARWKTEIVRVNRVGHAAIPRTLGGGANDAGRAVIVTDPVSGESLEELRRAWGGHLPGEAAMRLLTELVDALDAAHAKGIVHGALRPESVYVDNERVSSRIGIVDFAYARLLEESYQRSRQANDTAALSLRATTLAPEQRNAGFVADARTDIYSAAAIGMHLLGLDLGQLALSEAAPAQRLELVRSKVLAENLPESVADILFRALHPSRPARHPAARLLGDELRAALGDRLTVAPRHSEPVEAGDDPPTIATIAELQHVLLSEARLSMGVSDTGVDPLAVPRVETPFQSSDSVRPPEQGEPESARALGGMTIPVPPSAAGIVVEEGATVHPLGSPESRENTASVVTSAPALEAFRASLEARARAEARNAVTVPVPARVDPKPAPDPKTPAPAQASVPSAPASAPASAKAPASAPISAKAPTSKAEPAATPPPAPTSARGDQKPDAASAEHVGGLLAGRYFLDRPLASGGMATVYLGCLVAGAEMVRTVAIKRVHASLAVDAKCTAMMLDEARLASRISHPNVVPILDVIRESGEIMLVLEYVHGVTASQLAREGTSRTHLPPAIAAAIVVGALRGLHAAHRATDEHGRPMGLVHRDVSPQNIMVGIDGAVRVIDFGIARALGRAEVTTGTELRGKVAYMAPERLRGQKTDLRVDLWSAGVVLWELVSGKKLFEADDPIEVAVRVCTGTIPQTGNDAIDAVLERALARDLDQRFKTAAEMADALEQSLTIANSREITEVLHKGCEKLLNAQSDALASLRQRFASRKPGELVSSVARTPIAVDDDPGPDVRQEDTGPTSIRRSPVDTRDAAPLELVVPASIPRQPIASSSGQASAAAPVSGAIRTAAPVPAAGTPPHSGTVPRAAPVASSAKMATAAKVESDLTAPPASDERPVEAAPLETREPSAPQQDAAKLETTMTAAGGSSRKGATQPLAPPMTAPTPEPPSADTSSAFAAVPASRKGSTIPLVPAQPAAAVPVAAPGPAPEAEPVIELDTSRGPPARTSQTVPIGAPASSTGPVSLGPLSPHTPAGMAPMGPIGMQRGEARTSSVPWGVIGAVLAVVVLVFGLLVAVLFAMSGN